MLTNEFSSTSYLCQVLIGEALNKCKYCKTYIIYSIPSLSFIISSVLSVKIKKKKKLTTHFKNNTEKIPEQQSQAEISRLSGRVGIFEVCKQLMCSVFTLYGGVWF